ncbi:TMhelix containing protein [Vibrio phage 1.152.O._10N.222.46.E1]|uniref:TMhelix containing protein n=4 Tax=Nahantvirus 49C7 TaxID=2846601 RepID=A0A2I7RBD1_9CAUD|nr:TMhelix containing protein [Vibrio phage 1.025.O._10N.222.46.B6]AUR90780.1 TMhelix containing protein [Vibrio phage 1.150.O._10N.222.46.A6]AUR90953.1 TMhelix containing protein [Vibrio phage 1.152.O._10N.222.46.E1]AUS02421.1 TMhelix containing protein [Vibrio phage 2.130.O._10N.222.46.C2]
MMHNKFFRFMFKPFWNVADILIYVLALTLMIPTMGLWGFIPIFALIYMNTITEAKIGWEVFDNTQD